MTYFKYLADLEPVEVCMMIGTCMDGVMGQLEVRRARWLWVGGVGARVVTDASRYSSRMRQTSACPTQLNAMRKEGVLCVGGGCHRYEGGTAVAALQ
jgi:hypothetical protein